MGYRDAGGRKCSGTLGGRREPSPSGSPPTADRRHLGNAPGPPPPPSGTPGSTLRRRPQSRQTVLPASRGWPPAGRHHGRPVRGRPGPAGGEGVGGRVSPFRNEPPLPPLGLYGGGYPVHHHRGPAAAGGAAGTGPLG